jgi:hypothetical protein
MGYVPHMLTEYREHGTQFVSHTCSGGTVSMALETAYADRNKERHMTRETTVGLVVAGSFLCLVGVVVASRLGRKPDAKQADTIAQTIVPEEKNNPKIPPTETEKNLQQANFNTKEASQTNPPKSNPVTPIIPPIPETVQPPPIPPVLTPNTDLPNVNIPPLESQAEKDQKEKLLALNKAASPGINANIPGRPQDDLGIYTNKGEVVGPPYQQPVVVATAPQSPPGGNQIETPALPPIINPKNDGLAPPPPLDSAPKDGLIKQEGIKPPAVIPPDDFGSANAKNNSFPSAPSNAIPLPPPPAPVMPSKQNEPEPYQPALAPNKSPNPISSNLTDPSLPPLGSGSVNPPPFAVQPSSNRTGEGNLPKVTGWNLVTYFCKPEDRSFTDISNRYFGTPKYAKALQKFNSEHPLARDNVKLDNPVLQLGQPVFVPPKEVLESRFASLIDNRPSPSAVPISINLGANSNTGGQVPAIPTTIGRTPNVSVPTKDITRPYRVQEQGQMLIEIAQQTLGDRSRWSEIYRLNPTVRPEVPVPGGTEIRLPASANLP